MAEMKSLTIKGNYYEIVDERARQSIARNCAPVITETVTGSYNVIYDSADNFLQSLKVYGKSEQINTKGLQLFDCSKVVKNTYVQVGKNDVITIECDNTGSSTPKYAAFYTPVSTLLKTSTQYAIVLEVLETNSVGETYYATSYHENEPMQFTTSEKLESPSVGTHIRKVTTLDSFDSCIYMCRNFVTIPAGVYLRSSIRLSVWGDPNVTTSTFKYEPFTNGLPTPSVENPQEIRSVESPTVGICTPNLLDQALAFYSTGNTGEIVKVVDSDRLFLSGTPSKNYVQLTTGSIEMPTYWKGRVLKFGVTVAGNQPHVVLYFRSSSKSILAEVGLSATGERLIYVPEGTVYYEFAFCLNRTTTNVQYTAEYKNMYLCPVAITHGYQRYNIGDTIGFSWSINIPLTLRGISTDSGSNYTDSDGNQWISDEFNFKLGLYTQRIGTVTFDGSEDEIWNDDLVMTNTAMFRIDIADSVNIGNTVGKDFVCSHFKVGQYYNIDAVGAQHTMNHFYFRIAKTSLSDVSLSGFKAWLAANPITVVYALGTPVTTLFHTGSVTNAFSQLRSFYPYTVVMNDYDAWMETSYAVDVVAFVKNAIADSNNDGINELIKQEVKNYLVENPPSGSNSTIGVAELLASKWVGSGNLYSQTVTITGVTKNSQVDLTPSVEQLVTFYEKDLTFVTENENGIVTVYAIGQKPANDYTIQVTITEVNV